MEMYNQDLSLPIIPQVFAIINTLNWKIQKKRKIMAKMENGRGQMGLSFSVGLW